MEFEIRKIVNCKVFSHSFQGTLLKHLEEHIIQSDMTRDDIMIYYTTVSQINVDI